jgi:PleD family two-component response regulator
MSRHVLLVEPQPTGRREVLAAAGYSVVDATDADTAVATVAMDEPDVVVLDLRAAGQGGLAGFALCSDLRRAAGSPGMGIIVMADGIGTRERVAGLSAGADDVVGDQVDPEELAARIDALARRADALRAKSRLTGLPGPFELDLDLTDSISRQAPFGLALADIDHFAAFNRRYGHDRGDQAIIAVARIFAEALDGMAAGLFHMGGDDFGVVADVVELPMVLDEVCRRFDDLVPHLHDPHDAARGYFELERRQGGFDETPLIAISIGVVNNTPTPLTSASQAIAIGTEMRLFSKTFRGSVWRVDRRRIGPRP